MSLWETSPKETVSNQGAISSPRAIASLQGQLYIGTIHFLAEILLKFGELLQLSVLV